MGVNNLSFAAVISQLLRGGGKKPPSKNPLYAPDPSSDYLFNHPPTISHFPFLIDTSLFILGIV